MTDTPIQTDFDSLEEMFKLVAAVDLSTTTRIKAFDRWKRKSGTRQDLLKLLAKQNKPELPAAPPVVVNPVVPALPGGRDPFRINYRTAISFSGGRTSGFMLWLALQANGGRLPPDTVVCFANTGKEREETLEFVRDCARHWGVEIVWLEYRADGDGFARVDFDTASRNGEPFAAIIDKRQYLPNPVTRFCTVELKIRTMHKYLASLGWKDDDDGWDQMVGIRADEPGRVSKIRARPSTETVLETMILPLADAGITKKEVAAFWNAQPFNLGLTTRDGTTPEGNCDLCFLKGPRKVMTLIRKEPQRAIWWARQESQELSSSKDGALFRNDRASYQQMHDYAVNQGEMFAGLYDLGDLPDEASIECFCGD
jgi:3'-phosphoadenosine 5'-phosphosulfate sulfotransferase (PAPS reductase)/FAD synthetase